MGTQRTVGDQQDASFTEKIVERVAEYEGIDPLELAPPLFEVFDPDAAEALVTDPTTGGPRDGVQLEFTYCGYDITVEGDDVQITSE